MPVGCWGIERGGIGRNRIADPGEKERSAEIMSLSFNSVIERLNLWGDYSVRVAWPLFWQSTILIGGMFFLDYFLRRKLRPSVRQALWLVVLIKLILPPNFAFPTGIGWW